MRPAFLSIGLFLVFFAAALADTLLSIPYAEDIGLACFCVFILLELVNVARLNLIAAAILACIGIITGAIAHDVYGTLHQGAERTVPFMLLFAGVLCLRLPANASPVLLSLRDTVVKQPPGRRFIMTSVTSHCLTVVFNLAGITLLSSLISSGTEENLQRRLGRAVSQGMASASCWAPFFVAAVVIYSNLPTVRWSSVAPVGFVLSMLLIGWSWLTDRLLVRPGTSAAKTSVRETPYSLPLKGRAWLKLAFLLALLLSAFILSITGAGLTIPVAMAIIAPPFSFVWLILIRKNPRADMPESPDLGSIFSEIPGLRNEATLFYAANILAVGIGAAVAHDSVAATALSWVGSPFLLLALLMIMHGVANALGVHPVVPAILIPTLLPPQAIGIPPELMALALLGMWGQGASVSPFSATVFVLARLSGLSNWTTSWGWNGWYVCTTTMVVIAFLYAVHSIGYFG